MIITRYLIAMLAAALLGATAQAATLGLQTRAPTIGASGTADYFEFGPEGDLSMFGGMVSVSSLTTLDVASASVGFGVGFDTTDPEGDADGGFVVLDAMGPYLSGDLIALGFRGAESGDGVIELQFGNLFGRGVPEWTDTLLMNVIFDGAGENPFLSLSDGDYLNVEIGILAVDQSEPPSEVPLPSGGLLLVGGLGVLMSKRRRRA